MEMILDEMQDINDNEFEEAVREHRKRSCWMPTSSDLFSIIREVSSKTIYSPQLEALPMRTNKEQNEYNAKKAREFLNKLAIKMGVVQ